MDAGVDRRAGREPARVTKNPAQEIGSRLGCVTHRAQRSRSSATDADLFFFGRPRAESRSRFELPAGGRPRAQFRGKTMPASSECGPGAWLDTGRWVIEKAGSSRTFRAHVEERQRFGRNPPSPIGPYPYPSFHPRGDAGEGSRRVRGDIAPPRQASPGYRCPHQTNH
jgi:hypothetical protein